MAAPGSVELKQDVIFVFEHDFFVVFGYDYLDWTFLFFGNGLGFHTGFDFAVQKVLDEFTDFFFGKFLLLVEGEFLVLFDLLDGEGGPGVLFEV